MSGEGNVYTDRAAELRKAFDRAFEAAPDLVRAEWEDVLALGIAGDRYAVRLREIAGITKCGKVVPVPTKAVTLLGLAGIRGEALPVFSLAGMLNYASADAAHWLLLCGHPARLGLAVGQFNGCFQVDREAFSRTAEPSQEPEMVTIQSVAHTVINIQKIVQAITAKVKEP